MNNLTIENAKFWKDHFMKLVKSGDSIDFDLSGLESVDLSGVQILIGLYRECVSRKIELKLSGNLATDISDRIKFMGLCDGPCSSGSDVFLLIQKMVEN